MPETRTIAVSSHDRTQWRPGCDRHITERAGCPVEVVPAAINRPLTRGRSALELVRAGWFTLRRR
jgi:hypothetical protein